MIRYFDSAAYVREHLSPTDLTDELCCIYAEAVIHHLWGEQVARAPSYLWRLWAQTGDPHVPADPWGPVRAAQQSGIASAAMYPTNGQACRPLVVGAVHLCQGWRGTPFGAGVLGHTWLWYAATPTTGFRIDSAAPKYRPAPGPECRLTTWAEITSGYVGGVAVAALREPPR